MIIIIYYYLSLKSNTKKQDEKNEDATHEMQLFVRKARKTNGLKNSILQHIIDKLSSTVYAKHGHS